MGEHEVICPNCESRCRSGAIFCDACGERLPVNEQKPDSQAVSVDDVGEPQLEPEVIGETNNSCEQAAESSDGNAALSLGALDEKLDRLLALFEERIARTDYETATLKKLSDEVQNYREDLYRKLTLPLIKDMIGIRDALTNTIASCDVKDGGPAIPISVIEIFANMVRDSLGKYGVSAVEARPGDTFEAAFHKVVARADTTDQALHGHIASASTDCYMLAGECISPAMVTVFAAVETATGDDDNWRE